MYKFVHAVGVMVQGLGCCFCSFAFPLTWAARVFCKREGSSHASDAVLLSHYRRKYPHEIVTT